MSESNSTSQPLGQVWPWYPLHLSTLILVVQVIALMALANVPGERDSGIEPESVNSYFLDREELNRQGVNLVQRNSLQLDQPFYPKFGQSRMNEYDLFIV